jgi:anti-anti-sigma regulatory factor
MEITVSEHVGDKTVTILSVDGYVDSSNYTQLVEQVEILFRSGMMNLLLDLEKCGFISSVGLRALYNIAMIMHGDEDSEPAREWASFKEMRDDIDKMHGTCCKIVNMQPKVKQSMEITGMLKYLEIYDDLATALASF